jgi:hypothetical protein
VKDELGFIYVSLSLPLVNQTSFAELASQGLEGKHPLDILVKEMDTIWFQTDSRYNLQESDRKLIHSIPKYSEMLAAFEEYVMGIRKVAEPSTIQESPFIHLWDPFVRSSSWYADKKDSVFKSESTFRYIRLLYQKCIIKLCMHEVLKIKCIPESFLKFPPKGNTSLASREQLSLWPLLRRKPSHRKIEPR